MLSLKNIGKRFGEHQILDGLSVEIPLTGITFIVGASGSGTSGLCRLAVGLLKPDAGEVSLFGERVDLMPERKLIEMRARAPYLVQGPALLDWLTLRENVALADPPSKSDGRADKALERLGLTEFSARKPPEVGPGIRKRAAIARALVLEPEVLLLDEPTTGLDKEAAGQVNDALALVREQGLGVALVSHDYAALRKLADRVVQVKDKKVGFNGSALDFLTAPH
ncbi:MAG: ATP-binding cassette domain-containing protein [Archangium sp.]|nr:ATP-binding cassette domain-containing protein [Archangium sp.]